MVNKKNRLPDDGFMQGEKDTSDGAIVDRDIMERARAAGINPNPLLEDIIDAVRNANSSNSDGVCTDSDVKIRKRTLIEKVQQILSKYEINDLEIGRYPDSYAMDVYTEVILSLTSSGQVYEQYHDGRFQKIELSCSWLENLHSPKLILYNLLKKLIEVTEKNRAKIKEIEELADDFSP